MRVDKVWVQKAIQAIHADVHRSADTHLLRFPLSRQKEVAGISLYLKDESTHPTGSLKHRLARSLFLYALCNGKITGPDTKVYEASSGSTAISEAYFARLIGLKDFYTIVPTRTSETKLKLIADYGGKVLLTNDDVVTEAKRQAALTNGYFFDQFTFSERATDWRGNNNIAETIFEQMELEPPPDRIPQWVVCGAGTGGTSATIGRFVRYKGFPTKLCVVDPPESTYFARWSQTWGRSGDYSPNHAVGSSIEGIGRPTPAESFLPEVIDAMVRVPNEASVGAMHYLYQTGRYYAGVSTGTNFIGALIVLEKMKQAGETGSIVTLLCDSGLRYASTYYSNEWLAAQRYPDGTPVYDMPLISRYCAAVAEYIEKDVPLPAELIADRVIADFLPQKTP